MKLITKFYLSIGLVLLVFLLATVAYFNQATAVEQRVQQVVRSSEIIQSTLVIHRAVINMQTGLRGYFLAGKENFLEPYYKGEAEYSQELRHLASLYKQDPASQQQVQVIGALIRNWQDAIAKPSMAARREQHLNAAAKARFDQLLYKSYNLEAGKKKIDRIKYLLDRIEKQETRRRQQLLAQLQLSQKRARLLTAGLNASAILAGLATTLLLGNFLRKRISTMQELAKNLAQGNFQIQIHDPYQDELSSLAGDMNLMARNLEESFQRLEKMNQELDQFAYIASHDLKAPLRAINSLSEWIEEDLGETTPEVKSHLALMRGRVARLQNLINGILEYSRIGRKNVTKTAFWVKDLLDEILDGYPLPPGFQITFPAQLPSVKTEKILLQQVFANLISNAIKYHDKPAGEINILYEPAGTCHQFGVSDNGPGIAPEYQERIFTIFQTIEARDVKESTGVGLAIVKKIVEEKGGRIWVESQPGTGATFYFTWPE